MAGFDQVWVRVRLDLNAYLAAGNVIEGKVERVEDGAVWLKLDNSKEHPEDFRIVNCAHIVWVEVMP